MKSRVVVVGIAGIAAGFIAGAFVNRQFRSGDAIKGTAAPERSKGASARPESPFKPGPQRDAPAGMAGKANGRLTLNALPAELDKVLNEPNSIRAHSMVELANRIDPADFATALSYLRKHKSVEARNAFTYRL